jgi:hypothetical protein
MVKKTKLNIAIKKRRGTLPALCIAADMAKGAASKDDVEGSDGIFFSGHPLDDQPQDDDHNDSIQVVSRQCGSVGFLGQRHQGGDKADDDGHDIQKSFFALFHLLPSPPRKTDKFFLMYT